MNRVPLIQNGLLNVYAKKVKTTDPIDLRHGLANRFDTFIFRDKACTEIFAKIPWYYKSKPRKNTKIITLNCWQWNLVWCS